MTHERRRRVSVVVVALCVTTVMGEVTTHTGFLSDLLCWNMVNAIDGANMLISPEAHTVHCMRDVPECANSGFGVLELKNGESEYSLKFKFDDTGNNASIALLRASKRRANVMVTVTGEPDGIVLRGARVIEPSAGAVPMSLAGDYRRAPESILLAHIALMLGSWGCLLPWGVAIAKRTRKVPPVGAWFTAHLRLATYGWGMQLAGFAMGVIYCQKYTAHFVQVHPILGLIVVLLGFLQPLNAVFRPHPEPKTWKRLLWEFIHKASGRLALAISIVTIITGILLLTAFAYTDRTVAATAACAALCMIPPYVYLAVGDRGPWATSFAVTFFRVLGAKGTIKVEPSDVI